MLEFEQAISVIQLTSQYAGNHPIIMEFTIHELNTIRIAELTGNSLVIQTAQDGLDLLGNAYYQGMDKVIIHTHQLTPDFFDLKTGLAGEILQKFSNYRIQLAIVGDFSGYTGNSITSFIYESNKRGQINFVVSVADALKCLAS